MSESSPIKDALYAEIDRIGQDKINELLVKKEFSVIFESIFDKAINRIQEEILEDEKFGSLAESFTHYLFTEMLVPSQRKISYENIELDLIIPNTSELKKNSESAIILFFVKTANITEIQNKILEIKTIQEKDDNIWVISEQLLDISQRTYATNKTSFGEFLRDAQNFIQENNMNKLNIFKTKM
tara:strand:+ start:476 stop:1027 length:552 start_codon:yes stop_codon:yes gene_type:complete